jgi:glycosyltransferase involved in cell wall biosynthesis
LADYGPNQADKWRNAAFAVVITNGLLGDIKQQLGGALPRRISVAPMGVDTTNFTRSVSYEPWTGTGPARIFSCGRLNPSKGHKDLLAAVSKLVDSGIDARLVIAGEDELGGTGYRLELERLIAEMGLAESVTLLGAVSEDVIRTRLEEAHVFALASHAEPLGVAIMEAMSVSVPVVVTGAGGVPELVQDQQSGLLVPTNNPAHFAAALARVLNTPDLARQLGTEGRRRVAEQFDSTRGAGIMAQLIRGV